MKYFFFVLLSAIALRAAEPIPLDSVVSQIVATNPELRFYEAEIETARASLRAADTRENPELGFTLGRKRVTDTNGALAGEGHAWSVSVSQTFEWPGRLALRKAVANQQVELAELGLARFRAALTNRARALAYGVYAAQEQTAATNEVAGRYEALRAIFLQRDPSGPTPLLETRVIEAQELALQRRATSAALAEQAALIELNQLRGAALNAPLNLRPGRLIFHAAPGLEALLSAGREKNFEFRAAQLEVEAQGFTVSLARHEQRPDFTVSSYYSEESAVDRERILGLGLTIPLPLNRRAHANTAVVEARQRQAETAVQLAQRQLEREIALATLAFETKRNESDKWSPNSGEKFREAAALADRHYRLGAVPLATYIEMQNSYLDAVEALLNTQNETLEAGLKLQLLTGLDLNLIELLP